MDYSQTVFNTIITVPQVISVIACICLFYSFTKIPKQSLGLTMILILCISDFIFHIFLTLYIWWYVTQNTIEQVTALIMDCALRFSILWASCISYLVLAAVQQSGMRNPENYSKKSFIIILSLCIVLSAICQILQHSLVAIILTMILPLSLSLAFTAFCYLRSASILKGYPAALQGSMEKRIKNLYFYSVVQLLTAGPVIFYTFFGDIFAINSEITTTVVYFLLGLVGFVNSSVYFFQRKGVQKASQRIGSVKDSGATSSSSVSHDMLMDDNNVEPAKLIEI